MNNLKVMHTQVVLGQGFTMYGTFDEPLFLAKNVAEWIDYSSDKVGQMLKTVDEDEKLTSPIHYSGQLREMWFLTEDGLYEVLMQSRKPIAKAFKKEVKGILKKLRKGNLNVPSYQIDNPIERAKVWIDEEEKRQQLQLEVKEKEEQLALAEPKLQALDSLTGNTSRLYTTGQIAANYGMSAIKMNSLLHDMRVQYKQSGVWKLYAKYEGNGYTATPTAKESKEPMITSLEVAEMVGREHKNVMQDIRNIIKHLEKSHIQPTSYFTESTYKDKLNRNKPMFLLTKQGCELYGKRLTGDTLIKFYEALNRIMDNGSTFVVVQPDRLEVTFFTHLSESLKPFGITFETQYPVQKYRLDAYIESLNIAIEHDEEWHEYEKDKDSEREKEIQAVLGCRFIRVSTKESHAYNIGKIIKGILG